MDELRKAGCAEILEETASGADRSWPVLAALLRRIRQGETLVVVKLDRLARSLEHLLEVVRTLEAHGAFLPVLGDPIDTATPQGRFMLQMLGAVADDAECAVMQSDPTGTQECPGLRRRSASHNLRPQRGICVRAALPPWPVAIWTEAISTRQSM
ncbi:MAG: recombinase family protein [Rhodopila sp.]